MDENKTLLQQVREKELTLNARLEQAARNADRLVTDAKKECKEIMDKADKEGREAALSYFDSEKEKINADTEAIKRSSLKKSAAIKEKAHANLPAATDRIVKEVTMQ